jgi:hypothetical protein
MPVEIEGEHACQPQQRIWHHVDIIIAAVNLQGW